MAKKSGKLKKSDGSIASALPDFFRSSPSFLMAFLDNPSTRKVLADALVAAATAAAEVISRGDGKKLRGVTAKDLAQSAAGAATNVLAGAAMNLLPGHGGDTTPKPARKTVSKRVSK